MLQRPRLSPQAKGRRPSKRHRSIQLRIQFQAFTPSHLSTGRPPPRPAPIPSINHQGLPPGYHGGGPSAASLYPIHCASSCCLTLINISTRMAKRAILQFGSPIPPRRQRSGSDRAYTEHGAEAWSAGTSPLRGVLRAPDAVPRDALEVGPRSDGPPPPATSRPAIQPPFPASSERARS